MNVENILEWSDMYTSTEYSCACNCEVGDSKINSFFYNFISTKKMKILDMKLNANIATLYFKFSTI